MLKNKILKVLKVLTVIGIIASTAVSQEQNAITITIGDGELLELVKVESGTFTTSGGTNADYTNGVEVAITQDYYIGKYEVTQAQYEAVMGNNPSNFSGANKPVELVSWDDAKAFCDAIGAVLPTEAQWEYAARGGKNSQGYTYSGSDNINDVAWYSVNSELQTHEVGTKLPNELGIYDMSGNVREWTADWYQADYPSNDTDPTGAASGDTRVVRGGNWRLAATISTVSYRYEGSPSYLSDQYGFRVLFSRNSIKTISFESNGGTVVSDMGVLPSAKITQPTAPTQTGYDFAGWYKDNDTFENEWDFNTDVVEEDITLYAKWTAKTYTITWEIDGEIVKTDENVPYGTMPTYDDATPTKESTAQYTYTFSDWSPEVSVVIGAQTYTAEFIPVLRSYNVEFVSNNGTAVTAQEKEYGSKIDEPEDLTRTGYSFDGWYKESTFETKWAFETDVVAGATTLYAKWTAKTYTITWKIDGVEVETDEDIPYGTMPTFDGLETKEPTAQYTYTFSGWSPEVSVVIGAQTYTAEFIPVLRSYAVEFVSDDEIIETQTKDYGTNAVQPNSPTKTGYVFVGWFNGDVLFDFELPITEDITLTAKWVKIATITIGDGISLELVKVEAGKFTPNTKEEVTLTEDYWIGKYEVTQAQYEAVMGINPSDFKTDGANKPVEQIIWQEAVDFATAVGGRLPTEAELEYAARGGKYSQGYTYSGSNNINDVAWYNRNSENQTHEVGTKAPNELGIYDMTGNVWEWTADLYQDIYPSSSTNPTGAEDGIDRVTRGGSWNYDRVFCSITEREGVIPSDSYNFIGFRVVFSGNLTIKTISFNSNGGTDVGDMNVPQGSKIIQPTAPTKANYDFSGWYKDNETFENKWGFNTDVVEGDIMLYAKWTAKTPTPIFDKEKSGKKPLFKETIVSDKMEIIVNEELGIRSVEFVIYDMTGNVVANGNGRTWDLRNSAGRFVANGSYLVVIEAADSRGQQYRWSDKLGVKR